MRSSQTLIALAFLFGACGDEAQTGRPLGAVCDVDSECGEGACLQGQCLDPDADEDRDGLLNRIESTLGTSITNKDSDGDGVSDKDEVAADFSAIDSDGDGIHDALESDIADGDGDCLPDQRDAEVTRHADLVARVCKTVGVCAEGTLAVTCNKAAAACDYAAISGYEASEVSCDDRDNDCDGMSDEDLPPGACVPVLVGLALDSDAETLTVGDSLTLVATASYDVGPPVDVSADATWDSTTGAASVVAGVVTALAPGTTEVSATFGDSSVSATITVIAKPVVLASLDVLPANPSVPLGRSITFSAVGHYSDGSSAAVTAGIAWKSSNSKVEIDASGVAATVATGSATITATVGAVAGSAVMTVTPAAPIAIAIALIEAPRVAFDGTLQLRAIAALTDGNELDLSDQVDWRSSDLSVATVDADGLVTGHLPGSVDITADLEGIFAVVPLDVVVALMPVVASRTPVRATVLDAGAMSGPGAVANISAKPALRAVRVDANSFEAGANATNVIVARPSVRVDHE